MANSNFSVVVPPLHIPDFKQLCINAASEKAGLELKDAEAKGTGEVWRLTARLGKTKVNVSAYNSGSVTFQGLDPRKLKIKYRVVNSW